jgi:mannose-P-dolichol utilization defect 1
MDAVRDTLKPIIHQIPKPVHDLGIQLIGDGCWKTLIWDLNFTDVECVKLAVSKALGTAIVGVSAIVKLPQLYNLVRSQSAAGISFLSYVLETIAYLITLAYNARSGNPFSTYGETALIAAQNVAIASLVLHYGGKSAGAAAFIAVLAGGAYALFNDQLVDKNTLSLLQAGAGVIGVASKLPQIFTIWQEGGTGQLSSFAVSIESFVFQMIDANI